MRLTRLFRLLSSFLFLAAVCAVASYFLSGPIQQAFAQKAKAACPSDDSNLKLPPGFCATVFADGIGHARHLAAASNGVVYVNTWSGAYYQGKGVPAGGFLVALQDTKGAGKANVIERFGETIQTGGAGGTGIGFYKGALYAEINDKIVRYDLPSGSIVPQNPPETIVSGLPLGGDHPMHPFIIDANGSMYIDVASATNSCQTRNRQPKVPGANPCTELETRGGIWRYDANKTNQVFSLGERFATGIRNGEGFAIDAAGRLFVTQHGRDQLHSNWPDLYKPEEEATLPAEEVMQLKQGGDYGWPECYYDPGRKKLVLAPEYGGDGGKSVGICAGKLAPAAAFPAHWAPDGMVHYNEKEFPPRYRDGVFIAFHGSWNRAPYAQAGYNIVFQPLSDGRSSGNCEIFADGFAGAIRTPEGAEHRPTGIAEGPDGALYISDDVGGRIYRVTYKGGFSSSRITPCPNAAARPEPAAAASAKPPEGTNPDAGLPVPKGATAAIVALGDRVYHGEEGGATCTGCHGANATGSPLGPNLTGKKWLWSDGSLAGIEKVITDGVPQPKEFRSPMPPKGGAQLSKEKVSAVAAYVWALSHKAGSSH